MKLNRLKRLSPRRLGIKGRIVLAAVIIIVLVSLYVIRMANSPAVGTVAVQKSDTTTQTITDSTSYSTLNNEYYNALYPSDLSPDFPDQKPADPLGYNYLAQKDDTQKVTNSLEIYVKPLPRGGIIDDVDYKAYQSKPKQYELSQKYIRGELVDVVTGNDGLHVRAGLWVHGNYLLIVKFKSDSKKDLDTKFETILKSIQWNKS